jgi:hypothetical protein
MEPGRPIRRRRTVALALLLGLLPLAAWADEFGPWSVDPRHPTMPGVPSESSPGGPSLSASPFGFATMVWSALLTRLDGPRCSHRPSCGIYARRALARHGLPLGVWLTLNRLIRGASSSAIRTLPRVRTPAGVFFLDPIENALFWRPDYLPICGR